MQHRGSFDAYGDTGDEPYLRDYRFQLNECDKGRKQMVDLSSRRLGSESKWLKEHDLSRPYQFWNIQGVELGPGFEDETQERVYVKFREHDKVLGLNDSNEKYLREKFGNDSDRWMNQCVMIYRHNWPMKGKPTKGICLGDIDGMGMRQPCEADGRPVMFNPTDAPGGKVPGQPSQPVGRQLSPLPENFEPEMPTHPGPSGDATFNPDNL